MAAQIGKIGCAMNRFFRKRMAGITLMELMIVLVIVAILVSIAYPSYIKYVRKSKRGEAQQLLLNWAINQEIFRSNNPEYATTVQLPVPTNDHYTFTLPARSATAYTLQAAATGDQANDEARNGTKCTPMTLTQNGVKSPAECWE
jgi:type IV pilus assembly protein PilE